MKVHVVNAFECGRYDIYIYEETMNGRRFAQPGYPWEWEEVTNGLVADHIKPILSIPWKAADILMTALSQAGVRPLEQSKVEGLLQAQTEHLRDLQNILRQKKIMKD